ncbi:MAG: carboxy-S-adenosyl-L-methionine synthase CmoA [Anaerohalosphaera sp.]|nr:carboxy-S-adenosyl-L-methionine synthase CmoA [Anaerohalosphaera sp.]
MDSQQSLDSIYSHYREEVGKFVFDDSVASAFDDMIRRSVPGYATVLAMVRVFAEQYAVENSNCYDLGCSLGAATLAIRKGIGQRKCRIIAVDNSPAMLAKCERIIAADSGQAEVELIEADINNATIENASVAVLNYTLQFINPSKRDTLIKRIYDGMAKGGILILSEKIALAKEACHEFNIEMHHHFKRLHGYSDLEISQKRKALENVLLPDTLETHEERLKQAGFCRIHLWFRCFNFVSIAAVK